MSYTKGLAHIDMGQFEGTGDWGDVMHTDGRVMTVVFLLFFPQRR